MKSQRADAELQAAVCFALAGLGAKGAGLAKEVARVGGVKSLLLSMRTHIKEEAVQAPATAALRAIADASDGCRKLLVEGSAVPMLCVVLKRHSLHLGVQRDGAAALTPIALHSGAGLAALAAEKEGVEVLVAAIRHCARERADMKAKCAGGPRTPPHVPWRGEAECGRRALPTTGTRKPSDATSPKWRRRRSRRCRPSSTRSPRS